MLAEKYSGFPSLVTMEIYGDYFSQGIHVPLSQLGVLATLLVESSFFALEEIGFQIPNIIDPLPL